MPVERDVLLKDHSNFRVGGPADFFFRAETAADLRAALAAARECGLRSRVIGGGYNLLFDDAGFRGLIVKNLARGLKLHAFPSREVRVSVVSGTPLSDLVDFVAGRRLAGLEFLAGIPG